MWRWKGIREKGRETQIGDIERKTEQRLRKRKILAHSFGNRKKIKKIKGREKMRQTGKKEVRCWGTERLDKRGYIGDEKGRQNEKDEKKFHRQAGEKLDAGTQRR